MAQTLTIAGAASLPLEDGSAVAPVKLDANIPYLTRVANQLTYPGAVTDAAVDLGPLATPGAKGLIVKCTAGSCKVKFQTNTSIAWPLAPGGVFVWVNPSEAFPTAAFITTTGGASVLFIAVG